MIVVAVVVVDNQLDDDYVVQALVVFVLHLHVLVLVASVGVRILADVAHIVLHRYLEHVVADGEISLVADAD